MILDIAEKIKYAKEERVFRETFEKHFDLVTTLMVSVENTTLKQMNSRTFMVHIVYYMILYKSSTIVC